MSLLRWMARQLSLDDDKDDERRRTQQQAKQQQQQQHGQSAPVQGQQAVPPWQPWAEQQHHQQQQQAAQQSSSSQEFARLKRQQERDATKAAAQAAAAGQPRPKPPKGPCGRACTPPAGGTTYPLPLASALVKGQPPWCSRRTPDLSLARLWDGGHDALHVRFPAGSGTPSSALRGGVQLSGAPRCLPACDCLLRFDFRTALDFPWTRGGKLGGGLLVGHGAASGYRHSATAASARVTWGPEGSIMFYAYQMEGTQQAPEYAQVAKLGGGCGDHLFPGTFKVERGVWNRVELRVRLNTPGCADGVAGLGVNGSYREYDQMVWRREAGSLITEVMLVTFFGGSWVTPTDTSIDFANFSLTVLE